MAAAKSTRSWMTAGKTLAVLGQPVRLEDANPTAPRLPDHGPLDDGEFARVVREPVKVSHADRRVLAAGR